MEDGEHNINKFIILRNNKKTKEKSENIKYLNKTKWYSYVNV